MIFKKHPLLVKIKNNTDFFTLKNIEHSFFVSEFNSPGNILKTMDEKSFNTLIKGAAKELNIDCSEEFINQVRLQKDILLDPIPNEIKLEDNPILYLNFKNFLANVNYSKLTSNIIYFSNYVQKIVFENRIYELLKDNLKQSKLKSEVGIIILNKIESAAYSIDKDRINIIDFDINGDAQSYYSISPDLNEFSVFREKTRFKLDKLGLDNIYESVGKKDNLSKHKPALLYLSLIFFKQFAEVETKLLSKDNVKKYKDVTQKLINETDFKIKLITANWALNIIRTTGFNVRGHFRLQPCGEHMQERKIIWINDFKKKGYSRKADLLNL